MSKVSEDFWDAVLNETLNVRADEWDGLTALRLVALWKSLEIMLSRIILGFF